MKWIVTIAIVLGSTALAAGPAVAKNGENNRGGVEKFTVCHEGDDGWERLDLPKVAADKHWERGALAPDVEIPGGEGAVLDENCVLVMPVPSPTLFSLCSSGFGAWTSNLSGSITIDGCRVSADNADLTEDGAFGAQWRALCGDVPGWTQVVDETVIVCGHM